jgi:hypothetical protein
MLNPRRSAPQAIFGLRTKFFVRLMFPIRSRSVQQQSRSPSHLAAASASTRPHFVHSTAKMSGCSNPSQSGVNPQFNHVASAVRPTAVDARMMEGWRPAIEMGNGLTEGSHRSYLGSGEPMSLASVGRQTSVGPEGSTALQRKPGTENPGLHRKGCCPAACALQRLLVTTETATDGDVSILSRKSQQSCPIHWPGAASDLSLS